MSLALHEPQNELAPDRASLRFAALEYVDPDDNAGCGRTQRARAGRFPSAIRLRRAGPQRHRQGKLLESDKRRDHKGCKRKKLLRAEKLEAGTDAAKNCLDRIRKAERYPLSREIVEKRSNAN